MNVKLFFLWNWQTFLIKPLDREKLLIIKFTNVLYLRAEIFIGYFWTYACYEYVPTNIIMNLFYNLYWKINSYLHKYLHIFVHFFKPFKIIQAITRDSAITSFTLSIVWKLHSIKILNLDHSNEYVRQEFRHKYTV